MTPAPGGSERDDVATAAALVAAIHDRDLEALGRLLDPDAEVVTGRSIHAGADAIRSWAAKTYDHLHRVYAIDEYLSAPGRVLALGHVEYVWTAAGDVADSTPVALLFELAGGTVARLTVHDDAEAALAEFEPDTA